jgi:hypothetical protein
MSRYNPYGIAALDRPSPSGDANMVSGTMLRYRREFTDPTLAAWDVVTGSGHSVSVTGGNLVVTTGTTINTETSLTTKEYFTAPFKAAFGFQISQKIANQDFFMELVAVKDDGTLDETAVASWRVSGTDSTTTTVARVETRNGQPARSQSGNITVATQTTAAIYEIVLESDEVTFHNKGADSSSAKTVSVVRNSVAPDPNYKYKLRYRIANTGTAPASTTTVTAGFVTAVDYTEILVELTGATGTTLGSSSLPVNITSGNIGGTVSLQASSSVAGTSIAKVNAAATTNATLVKSTAGRVYGYHFVNNTASVKYVRLYNLTTAPTVGTSVPLVIIPIAANATAHIDMSVPMAFGTGISYAITGAGTDLDATAVAVGDVIGHIRYL